MVRTLKFQQLNSVKTMVLLGGLKMKCCNCNDCIKVEEDSYGVHFHWLCKIQNKAIDYIGVRECDVKEEINE